MLLNDQQLFLEDFHEAVCGLRTGEIGRANTHLDRFINTLSTQLGRMSVETQQEAIPFVSRMLDAKKREDAVTLADCLEYELPAALEEADFSPTLLDVKIIEELQQVRSATDQNDSIASATGKIQALYAARQDIAGLATYFAGSLYVDGRYHDALALLEVDEVNHRLTPAGAYLISLNQAKASAFSTKHPVDVMIKAYASSRALRDGFLQLGWIAAENHDWQKALDLMNRDISSGRSGANGKADLSFVMAHLGNWEAAERLVEEAYAEDSTLQDRLGWLGWIGYLTGHGVDYFSKQIATDRQLDRAGIWGDIFEACHATIKGNHLLAEHIVERAYSDVPGKHSWFCAIGWLCVKSGDPATGRRLMARDFTNDSMPDFWKPSYALALAINGERDTALHVLATSDFAESVDIYHRIGFWHVPDACMTIEQIRSSIQNIRSIKDLAQLEYVTTSS